MAERRSVVVESPDEMTSIAGLWALQFGNGESLGDSNCLYFSAGPEDG